MVLFGPWCWDMVVTLVLHESMRGRVCGVTLVGQWLVSGCGGAKCGSGWMSCWAETCVSSVMRQGWVQWVVCSGGSSVGMTVSWTLGG